MNDYRDLMDQLAVDSGVFEDNPDAIEHFDDRKFRFGCMLVNQDGYVFRIRKAAIRKLKIVDSLVEWFHYGYMEMDNPNDVMEKPMLDLADVFSGAEPVRPYNFRADARDLLYIHMEPYLGDDKGGITPKLDNEVYTMRMLFSIYKIEDINDSEQKARNKGQKYYFHDYRYQTLIEKNTYYSTAKNLPPAPVGGSTLVSRKPVTQQTNSSRAKPTGEVIQDIFRSVFLEADITRRFAYDWSFGTTNIMYTSPSNFRAIDDINYLLDRHTTSTGDPCILKLDRYSNMWSFLPLSEYFSRSTSGTMPGVLQSERFSLSFDGSSQEDIIPPESKSFNVSSPMVNYHYPDVSIIDDYTFSEMDGTDCQKYLDSTVIVRHSQKDKQIGIDLPQHNIGVIREYFEDTYTSSLLGSSGGSAVPAWLSDTSRSGYFNFSVTDSWTDNKQASLSISRSKKILASVLLGNSMYFESKGFTSRRAGVWFTVDKEYGYVDGTYDQKVLGQYLTTRVEHNIVDNTYTNTIIGVKPHVFSEPNQLSNDIFGRRTDEVINE